MERKITLVPRFRNNISPMASAPRAFAPHDPRSARLRLAIAVATGLCTVAAIPARAGNAFRAVAGWDAAAVVLAVLGWIVIMRTDPAETRRLAAAEDPGRRAAWAIVILASIFALFANAAVLRDVRSCAAETRDIFVGLCVTAVAAAWLLTHTAYTLRYAHLYYRDDDEGEGGLTFPGEGDPAYVEFAYFAFTIGMCFQVSDVAITSRQIRRAVLAHSVLSFAYNTAILATAVSLVVGVLG
jgi:uncharacterized membrane protein